MNLYHENKNNQLMIKLTSEDFIYYVMVYNHFQPLSFPAFQKMAQLSHFENILKQPRQYSSNSLIKSV